MLPHPEILTSKGSFAYPVGPIAVAVRNVTAPSESEAKAKCTRLPYFKTSV